MTASSGPALQLLAAGLRLWIRQQCDAIEALELELEGSALQLLRGHLAGAKLRARGVRYRDLELEEVQLSSAPIQAQLPNLLQRQPLRVEAPFAIQGLVRFKAAELQHSLGRTRWRPLGDQLAEGLLGVKPLQGLCTRGTRLVLSAYLPGDGAVREVETLLSAEDGTITLRSASSADCLVLPMDPAIHIDHVRVDEGYVVLAGKAVVTP